MKKAVTANNQQVRELPQPDIDLVAAAINRWLVPAALNQPKKESAKGA